MKKFLSLVLALVMTMSLVTVSAGAKDFTDDDKINYDEAVAVLSEVGVVDGYADGNFNPDVTLNRGQAAKIICNLILGPTTASALAADTAPYSDVPATHHFAGYISYCAQQGIISGYADGTFRPTGTLTGYAFMKMLLGALGYDADVEGYTGANWSIQVAKQALNAGLDKGNDEFVGTKAVTREEACLYAFNTLKATMVEYSQKTEVTAGNSTVTISGARFDMGNGTDTDGNIKNDNLMQFAEKYFTKLTKRADSDDFARPATTWKLKAAKIGTYVDTPDATYQKDVKLGDIYADLGMTEKDEDAEVYINGVPGDSVNVKKGNTYKVGEKDVQNSEKIGQGTTVEVFYDDDTNSVRICTIDTYVATISKSVEATSAKDAYVVLDAESGPVTAATDEFETEDEFEDDQVVLYTFSASAKEIKSVVAAESVQGVLTKIVYGKSIDLDETTYKNAKYIAYEAAIGTENDLATKSEYTVYTDAYGNAIYVVEEEYVSSDYAQILAIESGDTGDFKTDRVKLLTAEGLIRVLNTDKDYAAKGYAPYDIVTYKVGDDNVATLKTVTASRQISNVTEDEGVYTGSVDFSVKKGEAAVKMADESTVYANSKTVFVVDDGDDVKVYTGVNKAPTIASKEGNDIKAVAYCKTEKLAAVIFIDASGASISSSSKDIIFLAGASRVNATADVDTSAYYVYNAVVNGEITTVKVDTDLATTKANQIYSTASYDKYDVAYALDWTSTTVSKGTFEGTVKLSGDYTIGLGKTLDTCVRWTVAEDANIFLVDEDGNIEAAELSDVKTDAANTGIYTIEDGQVTNLFVQLPEDSNPATSEGAAAGDTCKLTGFGEITYTIAKDNDMPTMATVRSAAINAVDGTWNPDNGDYFRKNGENFELCTAGEVYTVIVVEATEVQD